MSVVLIATLNPVPEHRAELLAELEGLVADVHRDDAGCELYALHEDAERIVLIEKWATADALAAHNSSAATARLGQALKGRLASRPDIVQLTPHPAGTAEQGKL